jgi:CSLREA domain-containing protein
LNKTLRVLARSPKFFFVVLLIATVWMVLATPVAHANSITVNSTLDLVDPTDGNCTLPEAIYAANTNTASGIIAGECPAGSPGMDTINLNVSGPILLSGYLPDLREDLTIIGDAGGTTISGQGIARSGFSTSDNVTLNISGLTIDSGYFPGGYGGAMFLSTGSNLNISNSTLSNNYSGFYGGAIASLYPTATISITNSTFYSNTSAYSSGGLGGAIYASGINITVTSSTFYSNTTTGNSCCSGGGAIYMYQGIGLITNSTFVNNTTVGGGGAIYTANTNSITLTHSTIANNTSGIGGALFTNGTTTLRGTIIANNSPLNCSATITNGGYNLRWPSTDTTCIGAFGDPKLAPLGNYGGLTKTMGLFVGSAAIDAVLSGCPPPTQDQRGVTRPVGARCDIGAFEGTLLPLYLPLIER